MARRVKMEHFNNRPIVYLHGYAASSLSTKPQILRKLYPHHRLLIPDLPREPLKCMCLCEKILKTTSSDTLIVGASLGGFYAYYLACKFKKDCLLINPVFQPALEAKKLLEVETNFEKQEMIINAISTYLSFTNHMNAFTPPSKCFVALGTRDDIIDAKASSLHFSKAFIKEYDDDHYMVNSFTTIMSDFESYLQVPLDRMKLI